MKKLTFLFFLLMSISALAQVKGITSDNHILKIQLSDTSMCLNELYITLNGNEYNGKIESIYADSVKSIDIIKPIDAQSIFGIKAAKGAILIETKNNVGIKGNLPLTPMTKSKKITDTLKKSNKVNNDN